MFAPPLSTTEWKIIYIAVNSPSILFRQCSILSVFSVEWKTQIINSNSKLINSLIETSQKFISRFSSNEATKNHNNKPKNLLNIFWWAYYERLLLLRFHNVSINQQNKNHHKLPSISIILANSRTNLKKFCRFLWKEQSPSHSARFSVKSEVKPTLTC